MQIVLKDVAGNYVKISNLATFYKSKQDFFFFRLKRGLTYIFMLRYVFYICYLLFFVTYSLYDVV